MRLDGLFQSFLDGPSRLYAVSNRVGSNAPLSSRLVQGQLAGRRFNQAGAAAVGCLFMLRCPAAIARLIITVVVDPINRGAFRPLTHIGKKVLKNLPSRSNGNAAPSIIVKRRVLGVATPISHRRPSAPSGGVFHPVTSILASLRGNFFAVKAAAASHLPTGVFSQDRFSGDHFFSAAITSHKPLSAIFGKHGKAPKFVSNHGGYIGFASMKYNDKLSENEA